MAITLEWLKKPNAQKILDRTFDDKAMLFIHSEWYRLYSKYCPRDTGALEETVEITSKYVRHKVPYAGRMYYGIGFNFRTDKNPLATAMWDQAAEQTQKPKLNRTIQKYIEMRRRQNG